jgi:hypothetical protein
MNTLSGGAAMTLSAEEKVAMGNLVRAIAADLRAGRPRQQIAADLVGQGWAQADADKAVADVDTAMRGAKRAAGKRKIIFGCLWFFGGLAVTAITYAAASGNGGGTYVVTWGAIIFGAVDIVRGLTMLA